MIDHFYGFNWNILMGFLNNGCFFLNNLVNIHRSPRYMVSLHIMNLCTFASMPNNSSCLSFTQSYFNFVKGI